MKDWQWANCLPQISSVSLHVVLWQMTVYHRSPDSWYMSYSAYFTVAMANAIKTIFWPVFMCVIVCEVSNCRGNAATTSVFQRSTLHLLNSFFFFFSFQWDEPTYSSLLQPTMVSFQFGFHWPQEDSDAERRAGDRCREERTHLGKRNLISCSWECWKG